MSTMGGMGDQAMPGLGGAMDFGDMARYLELGRRHTHVESHNFPAHRKSAGSS